jgi:5-methylcytosine-specific restriction endonuclease McrA
MGRDARHGPGSPRDLESAWVSPDDLRRERQKARELRQTVWWRRKLARGLCHYCGRGFAQGDLTLDHLVPLARGGRSTRSNCVPCCKECNTKKQSLLPLEWEEYLESLKR